MYNYIFIIGRSAFDLLQDANFTAWLILDYLCDFIYLLDIGVRFRTGMQIFYNFFLNEVYTRI
jgi:hypothetical protein